MVKWLLRFVKYAQLVVNRLNKCPFKQAQSMKTAKTCLLHLLDVDVYLHPQLPEEEHPWTKSISDEEIELRKLQY